MRDYGNNLKIFSRELCSNMTDAERLIWSHLRRKQVNAVQFYRQKPLGPFIVDFFAPNAGLVVEIDGSQHYEPEHLERDKQRDQFLADEGLLVLRFNNREVLLETEAVLERIAEEIMRRKSPRKSPPARQKSPPAPRKSPPTPLS